MYCTPDMLITRLGAPAASAIYGDDPETAKALMSADLAAAQAEIDGFVGARYLVPVTAQGAVALLGVWTLSIAEELAWGRVGDIPPPDALKARIERIRKHLERIADKTMILSGAAEITDGAAVTVIQCDKPLLNRRGLEGY